MSEVKQPSRTNPVRHNNQCSLNDRVCVFGDHWAREQTVNSELGVSARVRVIIAAALSEVFEMGTLPNLFRETDALLAELEGVVSIEVIEPPFVLPTKRWAQVTDNGVLWTLTGSGMWVNLHGDGRHSTKLTESSHLRVISEGVSE
jgi:hypothetical protein